MTSKKIFQSVIVLMLLLGAPVATFAQDGLSITVTTSVSCDQVDFLIEFQGDLAPNTVTLMFGDSVSFQNTELASEIILVNHSYPSQGEYEWILTVTDDAGLVIVAEANGNVTIDGPVVVLNSDPMPPLLTIESGAASIDFWPEVSDGLEPYTYAWDLDEDGEPDAGLSGNTASFTYTEGGKYKAAVTVTDACGLTDTATLAVVVVDPEDDPENACHPTAKKIADAVNSLLPYRAEDTYTCEDIFDIFEGSLTGNHTGFGRLWHAYQLTQTIDDLTWEEIRDWKLDGSSWGAITQLNRFADKLEGYGIRDLFDLVVNDDNTVREILTAARAAVRYDADLGDALQRLSDGFKAGELGQFYKLAAEMDGDPTTLDQYLKDGMSLSELSHAAKMSERLGVGWEEVIAAKDSDHSWGDIGQAYKLAGDGISAAMILDKGVQEFRAEQRDADKLAREAERTAARKEGLDEKTTARFSEQYGYTPKEITDFLDDCEGSWSCVRKELKKKDQTQVDGTSDKDTRTAERLAAQYGVDISIVRGIFDTCGGDWNCVRSELRATYKKTK
jgi:PKD repeat protein